MEAQLYKEITSDEHTDSDTISSIPVKKILNEELPKFVENSKPMSVTQDWYSESIPPDTQLQKRIFQPKFRVDTNRETEKHNHTINGQKRMALIP